MEVGQCDYPISAKFPVNKRPQPSASFYLQDKATDKSEIPFSVRAAECSFSGESIFAHDKNGKVAAAYGTREGGEGH